MRLMMGSIGQWESMRFTTITICVKLLCSTFLGALPLMAREKAIDAERSTITVRVQRAPILGIPARDYFIDVPVASGKIDEAGARVELTVDTAKMTIKPDPKVAQRVRERVQGEMDSMTLEPDKYPEIVFHSTHIEKGSDGKIKVDGTLTAHGVSRTVSFEVDRDGQSYSGHTSLKQTDYGMKPISLGGGIVHAEDLADIDFKIFAVAN
jgi:polyisoprenoid-binding protein YceI